MIIYGWKDTISDNYIVTDARLCAHCNNVVQWQIFKVIAWFTLFFVPLIPYNARYSCVCPVCNNSYHLTRERFFEICRQGNTIPLTRLGIHHKPSQCILFTLISIGIYFFFLMHNIAKNINTIAGPHDGKQTMNIFLCSWLIAYVIRFVVSQVLFMTDINHALNTFILVLAFMMPLLVWLYKLSCRVGNELKRRGIDYSFDVKDFWLYFVLGTFVLIGPFVFIYKVANASIKLAEHYNQNGVYA